MGLKAECTSDKVGFSHTTLWGVVY